MSKRDRIEIVETRAEQPWSVRIFRNEQTFRSSENYTRKVGAERAVVGLAMMFGWTEVRFASRGDQALLCGRDGGDRAYAYEIPVDYLQEMDQVKPDADDYLDDPLGRQPGEA